MLQPKDTDWLNVHKNKTHIYCLQETHFIPAAATAKSLQSCPTLCDPIDGAHQPPPSLEFSRQEHWSGVPFPSPMHESEM